MTNEEYPLILDDGGRNLSTRKRQQADCTVRALAIITDTLYDEIYDELAESGRKSHDGFDIGEFLKKQKGKYRDYILERHTYRYTMTINQVIGLYQKGRILIETHDHVFAVINGTAHDMIREPGDKRVYRIWGFY